ncbi:glycosyltransferase family 4 protein [Bacillus thuringiensis]|uniref:Glycosyltransferase n=1 Tax=Bacillus thuringiensis subsp. higo TaxID=132266 RepID=A0A9X6M2S5_BACUH|nr:glycosyltransferase family 4 protein [Bacillus thuringiensis]MED2785252.1 glycosyltransferase family 4 protein [Bacillus thuringiensis]MED2807229.1 glycosyltransferase family 4 protein [Bacillus thuringiensis]MED2825592.1 glycosyltransferase family 4 protein [Bacillus thuringiensis]MED2831690.1 glycosyltransferase family 4 protein [Bacillus thuringiensis]MED2847668.1 glycosyltransferase family 4 protein [Bacillus thuringiensis]
MKIDIIGSIPPPVGGISVHIKRTKKKLIEQGIECKVYNEAQWGNIKENVYPISTYKSFIFKIPFLKADILHFHSIDMKVRMLLGVYKFFGKKIILTVHGESLINQIDSSNKLVKYLLLKGLKKIDKIICVNDQNTQYLKQLGFEPDKIITIPAYINPIEDKEDIENIPNFVWEFIENKKFVISANGCVRFYNNEDLYGIDLLIKLVHRLRQESIDVSLVFVVLDVESQNEKEKLYYQSLKKRIHEYNLASNILFYEAKDTELYPILSKSHLFIRPTNTDGYGVSIAEALHYKIPSIASNVCIRPEGTILFNSRDNTDLYAKTLDVIENYENYIKENEDYKLKDNFCDLHNLYVSVIKN